MEYINSVSGELKTKELLEKYNADPGLVESIMYFDSVFPRYLVCIDEILAEGDRVIVRARLKAKHEGEFMGIAATHLPIEFPYVVGYEVQHKKIIHSWLVPDFLPFLEQIGVKGVLQPLEKKKDINISD